MSDRRFEELMSRLLDEELTSGELSELSRLAKDHPDRRRELQSQLETAEMLAQSEDDLRKSARFVSALESRIGEDPFVTHVRSASRSGKVNSPVQSRFHSTKWPLAIASLAAVVLLVFLLRPSKDNEKEIVRPSEPTPRAEPEIAKIAGLYGAIQWTSGGGQVAIDLEEGQWLRGGTIESLSTDSWVAMEFRDGSTLTISGQSALTISEHEKKELHLRQGDLSANVAEQPAGKPMLIHTPTAQLEVLGTEFNVDAERTSTVLTVNRGRVRVTRLSDGSVVEVPANHQVVAAASRLADFKVAPRLESVVTWRSNLPQGINYGKWMPATNSLRATPLLWHDCKKKGQKPLLLYLVALSASQDQQPPVALTAGAKVRIRGHMDSATDVVIGLTTHYLKGGFAGKHRAFRRAESFPKDGGDFDLTVRIEELAPEQPKSAIGLSVYDWWCLTVNVDAGLRITSLELIPAESTAPAAKTRTKKSDGRATPNEKSIEEKTKVHRLSTTRRAAYDAFVYVNRIPESAEEGESAHDMAGRILGRLANQEGRILLKLPAGMKRDSYLGLKNFLRYEGQAKVGNCVACHAPADFTDLKTHVVTKGGSPKPTPSLRNLKKKRVDLRKVILAKIAASRQKRSGEADEIDDAYTKMKLNEKDVAGLVAYLNLLNDVSDAEFRKLILDAKLLDTSKDIE